MKRLIAVLALLPALAFSAGNDLLINQRNPADTLTQLRGVAPPDGGGTNGILGYVGSTNLPSFYRIGSGLTLSGGVLDSVSGGSPAWSSITGKPTTISGYGITDAFNGSYASLTGVPLTFAPAAHTQAWSTITSTPTTLAGYGITDAATTSALGSYATTAALTSGLAGKFNTPAGTQAQYVRGDGSLATLPAASVSSQAASTRPLNTVFQVSASRAAWVTYSVQLQVTANIAGGQNGDVILEIASDAGFTASVQTVAISGLGQTYTLAVAIQGVQPQTGVVSGFIPAGYYVRLRTVSNTGTPTFSYRAGQETLM